MSTPKIQKTPNSETGEPTYYENLGQAAGAMDVPKSVLSLARKMNAPGFRGSRVYPGELLPWLKANTKKLEGTGQSREQLICRKLRGQCEGIEFSNQTRAGEFVPTADVDTWQTEKAESLKRLLTGKIINELLPKLTGLNVPEMVPIARGYITAIVSDFKKPLPK